MFFAYRTDDVIDFHTDAGYTQMPLMNPINTTTGGGMVPASKSDIVSPSFFHTSQHMPHIQTHIFFSLFSRLPGQKRDCQHDTPECALHNELCAHVRYELNHCHFDCGDKRVDRLGVEYKIEYDKC